ncbi:translation initiation factor IF-2-like [Panthera pardus]|uniref:Translation initiation factor IF-2-like n=1 Tax=Panthera pardus TaxID=9691 RepID=A0A9W2VAS6_PANPR|nr:translation initiation factor IF-2-like [Panthera pardus]XP_053755740.1 translation initiation factor IF-2-like [Panthera pardus]
MVCPSTPDVPVSTASLGNCGVRGAADETPAPLGGTYSCPRTELGSRGFPERESVPLQTLGAGGEGGLSRRRLPVVPAGAALTASSLGVSEGGGPATLRPESCRSRAGAAASRSAPGPPPGSPAPGPALSSPPRPQPHPPEAGAQGLRASRRPAAPRARAVGIDSNRRSARARSPGWRRVAL